MFSSENSVNDSYHYFQAETAEQALEYHESMMSKKIDLSNYFC